MKRSPRPVHTLLTGVVLTMLVCATVLHAESVRFAVVSDTQGSERAAVNEAVFTRVVDNVLAADPPVQFVLVTGDLVTGTAYDNAMLDQFYTWRQLAQPWYDSAMTGLKVYPVPGNHDQVSIVSYAWLWRQAFDELPRNGPADQLGLTYSFDVGNCHFVMLNTSAPDRPHRVDLDWLEADLADSDAPFTFVCGHDPAYPIVRHVGHSLDYWPSLRDRFWQVLAEHDVQAYFSGHAHVYDHWLNDGVHQIITGLRGSASVYLIVDVDDEKVIVSAFSSDGERIEQYALSQTDNVDAEARPATEGATQREIPCVGAFVGIFMLVLAAVKGLGDE